MNIISIYISLKTCAYKSRGRGKGGRAYWWFVILEGRGKGKGTLLQTYLNVIWGKKVAYFFIISPSDLKLCMNPQQTLGFLWYQWFESIGRLPWIKVKTLDSGYFTWEQFLEMLLDAIDIQSRGFSFLRTFNLLNLKLKQWKFTGA